ncbi:hypothetical protein GCM10009098_21700 [Rheinheimera aquimaris]|uniref:Uncharacterized protein n=1 Tax=Rheinheimera aquimaris TaxID=412437 RepID=A0ABN1DVV9_9GAMM|nr:hypothetical protein [Rheinheimera aquimaris]MCB5213926.1 hypothetical protein [Rheinheimera aquimaris]
MTIHISYEERMAYLHALKTRQATPASSAAFRKILQHARQLADACLPVQLELFKDIPNKKRV